MKRGYHSTQRKYFNTIPRSAFLGLALGYAVGLFLTGLFRLDGIVLEMVCLAIGTGIGYWIDGKYFAEKDVPAEELEAAEAAAEANDAEEAPEAAQPEDEGAADADEAQPEDEEADEPEKEE